MPRRDDLHKILILGSGPIVIGQAAEFDYSGVQACKVLREEGYEIVLVNSNPATIMTDPEFADATYVEPLLPGPVAQVIERERPDALLPTLGGQTALNLAKALSEDGTLERFDVELIGATYDAIGRAEDRDLFRQTMDAAGLRMPASAIATTVDEAQAALGDLGLPCIVRPAFTLGGRGGGVARSREDFAAVVRRGLEASPIGQVLLDQSVIGWGEFELEVMRDGRDNVVIVCSIENVDPMGVHTGDSRHGRAAADAHGRPLPAAARPGHRGHPRGGRRDRRLERAVRGQPGDRGDPRHRDEPARVAVLGAGLEGDRLPDREDRRAPGRRLRAGGDPERHHRASRRRAFEPTIDYVVVKWPRFAFEKFPGADAELTTHMKSRGGGHGDRAHLRAGVRQGDALARARRAARPARPTSTTLLTSLERPSADRYDVLLEALRRGAGLDDVQARDGHRPVVPARAAGRSRSTRRRPSPASGPSRRSTPAPPSSRRARRTTTRAGSAGAADEVRRGDRPSRRDPRRRARTASARASSSTTAACTRR